MPLKLPKTAALGGRDINGRPYLRIAEMRRGLGVTVDGGFSCLRENARRLLQKDKHGFYVSCNCGKHHLDGQLQDDYVMGFYKEKNS